MEQQILDLYKHILKYGEHRDDRTGTGTLAVFSPPSLKFDLMGGFPAVTTKKLAIKAVWHELIMFLRGYDNIKYLKENSVKIWDEWAREDGYVGPIYGVQWRRWKNDSWLDRPETIDQLAEAIELIKHNPTSRRIIVSAWNPTDIHDMALPPCHIIFQFYVRNNTFLDCKVYQRSADVFLGLPFDIASYATLVNLVGYVTDKRPGILSYELGDAHIYNNHIEQVYTQTKRVPYKPPMININVHDREIKSIDDFEVSDFALLHYTHYSALKGAVSK